MGTIVATAAINALKTLLVTEYGRAYSSPTPLVYPQLCTTIPSTKQNVLLAIMDMVPEMREWVADRVYNNPAEHSQLLLNPHYELSMSVDADNVADDDLGTAFLSAGYLGEAALEHPDVLLGTVMKNGQTAIGFDGSNFFDTTHPTDAKNGTGTQYSNYESTGRALSMANWELVKGNMASWRAGPSGRIIGSVPTLLVVPRQLEGVARRILEADSVASVAGTAAETNVNKGTAKVVVFDQLNSAPTTWYAIDDRSILKPFAFVKRSPPTFVMKNRPDDEGRFQSNQIQFGVDGRWGVGIGPWFRAYKAVA